MQVYDPDRPICPACKSRLKNIVKTKPYTEPAGQLNIYRCGKCGAITGHFVPDVIDPDDPYIVIDVSNE